MDRKHAFWDPYFDGPAPRGLAVVRGLCAAALVAGVTLGLLHAAGCTARGDEVDADVRTAGKYKLYVLVPYQRQVDELLTADILAGRVDPAKLGCSHVRAKDGKIQHKVHTAVGKPEEWVDEEPGLGALLAMFVLGKDVCHYDNEGNYYLRMDWYERWKPRLPSRHPGRLEYFLTAEAAKRWQAKWEAEAKAGRKVSIAVDLDKNLFDFVCYVWDAADKVWRYPGTLAVVPRDRKTPQGKRLYDHEIGPAAEKGPIEDLLDGHARRLRKAEAARPKDTPPGGEEK